MAAKQAVAPVHLARRHYVRAMIVLAAILAALAGLLLTEPQPKAHASTLPRKLVAFFWARQQAGKPYIYGGTGPYGFDCSGLVERAYAHAGISLPRTTFEMLAAVAWGKLIPEAGRDAHRGDLAFYGSGHVEFFVRPGHTFGAHDSGTRIGWIRYGSYWHPTLFFHVRGAG